jgi:two-component SAPR family response regulator
MPSAGQNAPKALVLEDELLVALHVAQLLSDLGFQVVGPIARVIDALSLIDNHSDLSIALLDINLAGEMSWPVARALLEREVPFIFITGYQPAEILFPSDLSESTLLIKPINSCDLNKTLMGILPENLTAK